MADLKPRQYKRLGRIEEKNPERAARVAGRMEKRASREERGKAIAKSASEGRGIARQAVSTGRARAEAQYRPRVEEEKGTTAVIKRMAEKGRTNRPDTPLADSPVPSFFKSK
jgi:hypothetical protein